MRKLLVALAAAGCGFACRAQDDGKSGAPDPAVDAAMKLGITCPVQAREWHIWWGAPLGDNPSIPAWEHWKGLKRFGKFDPQTTIEETVPGSAWRRYLNSVGYPLIGPYDSGQEDVIRWQLETARNAGLDCLHIHLWPSLWDEGADLTPLPIFDIALTVAEKLKYPIAVHDEIMFRKSNITKAQQLENTITRTATLVGSYGGHPGWKKIDGRPVYYFQNSNKWMSAKDMQTYMSEVEKKSGPVYWIVEMGADEEYLKIPQLRMLFGPNCSWFLHTPPFGAGPHPWEDVRKDLFRTKELAKKYGKKLGVLVYAKFNNNNDRGEPGKGWMDAEDGNFYLKGLSMAKDVDPDLIIVTQWNDFEEGGFIEPAWDYEGFNGDPYRYCRITAAMMGKPFIPAPLPRRSEVDPLIRHKLFGDSVAGDAGPVFQIATLSERKLAWKWCEGSGDPVELRVIQSNLLRWTPDSPAMGPVRVSNLSQVDEKGTLKEKAEFRFYVPGMICGNPADLWVGVRASSTGSLRITYRAEMSNYRVDSRWEKRFLDTGRSAFIEMGDTDKVYWMPMRGARFSGWEGDVIVSANGSQPCELKELLVWNPGMREASLPVSWKARSVELPQEVDPLKPFVVCAYDALGNAGLPRLFHGGRTTPSSTKEPMDLLQRNKEK